MKVTVDLDACAAQGSCVATAPDLFDLGDNDLVVRVLQQNPSEDLRESAQAAADACPMFAISVED